MGVKERKKRSPIWTMPSEEFAELIRSSNTIATIMRHFGFARTGRGYRMIHDRIKTEGIDASHIALGHGSNAGRRFSREKTPLSAILVEESPFSHRHLKTRLLAEDILRSECYECGQKPCWNGKRLVLVLDHINGKRDDHRLSNLRLLCPNCNSQQSTFSGRNNRPHHLTV